MYLTANLQQGLKIGTVLETISKTLNSISTNVVTRITISCVCGIVREVKSLLSVCISLVPRPSHRTRKRESRKTGTLPVFSAKILAAPIRLLTDSHVT